MFILYEIFEKSFTKRNREYIVRKSFMCKSTEVCVCEVLILVKVECSQLVQKTKEAIILIVMCEYCVEERFMGIHCCVFGRELITCCVHRKILRTW